MIAVLPEDKCKEMCVLKHIIVCLFTQTHRFAALNKLLGRQVYTSHMQVSECVCFCMCLLSALQ